MFWKSLHGQPFYIKASLDESFFNLAVTDFEQYFESVLSMQDIKQQKRKFNPTFQVACQEDLLNLLMKLISSDRTQFKIILKEQSLMINCVLQLQIYPFSWKFTLFKTQMQTPRLVRQMVMQPLKKVLEGYASAFEQSQRELRLAQEELDKKLSQAERKRRIKRQEIVVRIGKEQTVRLSPKVQALLSKTLKPQRVFQQLSEKKPIPIIAPSPAKPVKQQVLQEPVVPRAKSPAKKKKKIDFL